MTESGGEAMGEPTNESMSGQEKSQELTGALEHTLENLSQSIQRMEAIIAQLESGEADWEGAVELLSEANDLAVDSSQRLEQAVQEVVYGESGAEVPQQQELELPTPESRPGEAQPAGEQETAGGQQPAGEQEPPGGTQRAPGGEGEPGAAHGQEHGE